LAGFIDQHAKPHCEVILLLIRDAAVMRGSVKKIACLGYSPSQSKAANVDHLKQPFRGQILRYHR
jgi:hypothetical protein